MAMSIRRSARGVLSEFLCRMPFLLLALCVFIGAAPARAAETPHRVLLLEGLTDTQPSVRRTLEAFTQRLKQKSSEHIEVFSDFLDLGRFSSPAQEARLISFLNAKFDQLQPEVVIPISREAAEFVIKHRDDFTRSVPIIYCCAPALTLDSLDIPPDIPGVVAQYDWAGTLSLAERLQPHAKTLVIISGASDLDHARNMEVLQELRPFLPKYNTKYLTGLPYDEMLREVSRLPRDSIVLLTRYFEDSSGRPGGAEIAEDISEASPAPVYSTSATYFGLGVVGGRMQPSTGQGVKVADLALEVLSGKDPSTLPHQTKLPLQNRVDARQLKRWGMSESLLPVGTSVEFKPPPLWQQNADTIVLALLAFAAQLGIIALLLVQKRKRHAAEVLLKESEDRMAFAAASANIGLWRFDVTTGTLWATEHCRRMFGITNDAPLAWDLFRAAVHPDDRHAFGEWVQSLTAKEHPAPVEVRVLLPGRGLRWYGSKNHAVTDIRGKPLQVTGIFKDGTARRAAEAEAEFQRKELTHMMRVAALGELSGGIAHELSQPLASILANAQAAQALLANRAVDRREIGEILEDIVQEDSRAGEVVHRLRRLLRKGEHQSALVSMNDLITLTLGLLRSELMNRRIKIETALKTELPLISGDSVQLQQVLLNLTMNAVEAMGTTSPAKRKISIGTRTTKDGCVEVSITDSGPGMAPEELKRVFEPFFTTKERGLGLGLSICSTIIRSHRGRLNLANANVGGMTATVSLPMAVQLVAASEPAMITAFSAQAQ